VSNTIEFSARSFLVLAYAVLFAEKRFLSFVALTTSPVPKQIASEATHGSVPFCRSKRVAGSGCRFVFGAINPFQAHQNWTKS